MYGAIGQDDGDRVGYPEEEGCHDGGSIHDLDAQCFLHTRHRYSMTIAYFSLE
jgi:hypothetical protein